MKDTRTTRPEIKDAVYVLDTAAMEISRMSGCLKAIYIWSSNDNLNPEERAKAMKDIEQKAAEALLLHNAEPTDRRESR
jgi:hypothetical protein